MPRPVRVRAPATIGNFGPGFDVCSLAVHGLGDTLELRVADRDALELKGPAEGIPRAWEENAVGVVLDALRSKTGVKDKLRVRVTKGMPAGSGLGSSASSAGGAALAFHALFGKRRKLTPEALVQAAADGEGVAAGKHFDDVSAVVLGGLALVQERPGGLALSRVAPPRALHLAFARPHVRLDTKAMRRILPKTIPRGDAVANLGATALLVDAMHRGDIEAVGACVGGDRIAMPARSEHVPGFEAARRAALQTGAAGAALSGSGPTIFAVARGRAAAERAARAMGRALSKEGVRCTVYAAKPEAEVMHRAVALRSVRP